MKIGAIIVFAVGGFMIADVLAHPQGTKDAGGVITSLWTTTAQGVSGQKISA
jgi:hypoxanthine phosphoribosyltransferase